MNDNKRRAIVWDTIERLAFRPNDPQNWLGVYARTMHVLWDIDPTLKHLSLDDEFVVPLLNLKCDYSIESVSKYTMLLAANSAGRLNWQTHVDPNFLSKSSLQPPVDNYPRQQMDNNLRRDVEAVLNGMLFHPRCHAHIEDLGGQHVQLDSDRGGLSSHEVRIGGGVENPYVFLFHLRYQLCLVSEQARQTERQRLIDLFEMAIIRKDKTVNARDLFNFQRGNN